MTERAGQLASLSPDGRWRAVRSPALSVIWDAEAARRSWEAEHLPGRRSPEHVELARQTIEELRGLGYTR